MRIGLVLVPFFLFPLLGHAEEMIDGIAAQVGSEIVLVSEVRSVSGPAESRLLKAGGSQREVAMLQAEILEQMIERALIRQVVMRAELDATDAEVDESIAGIAAENGLTLEQLQESVISQGLSYEGYRERIRAEIEHSKVMSGMVASRVRLDEKEVREFYEEEFADQPTGGEEYHLRHILVPFEGRTRATACSETKVALARIQAGEAFPEVASTVSAVSPQTGGDIGWLHSTSLAGWMAPVVAELQAGQTSGVLETDFGCNLLQVVERRPWQRITYDQVKERLRQHLFGERMNAEYREFIDSLREQTYIERKGMFADATRLELEPEPGDVGAGEF